MAFKEKAIVFSQETTMHGVQYVGKENAHWLRRLVWLLTVLSMLCIAAYMIVEKIMYFYSYPTETKTTIANENRLDFPSVTICNLNKFRRTAFGNETHEVAPLLKLLFDPSQLSEEEIAQVLSRSDAKIRFPNEMYLEMIETAAHNISEMIWQMFFKGVDITGNTTDYFTPIMTDEGICHTFHSEEVQRKHGHTLNVTSTGAAGGLWLRLNVQQTEEYFFGPENSAGFKILVHDPKKFPLVGELGFAVSPGAETFVSVKKNEVKSLPPPYEGSICRDTHDETFRNPLMLFNEYNQPACRLECQTNFTMEKCGCRVYYQPGGANDSFCSTDEVHRCWNPAMENYTRSTTALSECDCFQECETTSYAVSVSSALYPAQHILDDLRVSFGLPEDYIRKNFLEVRIFYEEMNIDITDQKPAYNPGDLLADVGGTAGLFLGASLLTAMEMGEFLLLSVISFFKHLSDAGQIHDKSKMGLGNPEETQEKNGNVIKERDDVLGLYNTIFSTNSPTNVQKIKVQEKS